jgi:hypothetical protein
VVSASTASQVNKGSVRSFGQPDRPVVVLVVAVRKRDQQAGVGNPLSSCSRTMAPWDRPVPAAVCSSHPASSRVRRMVIV